MKKYISATIRIGQEIWCLPYALFFFIEDKFNLWYFTKTITCSKTNVPKPLKEEQWNMKNFIINIPINTFFAKLNNLVCNHIGLKKNKVKQGIYYPWLSGEGDMLSQ